MRLAKIDTITRQSIHWDGLESKLRICSVLHHSDEDRRLDKYFGVITLSFKKGKKRILVKGEMKCDWDDTKQGLFIDWYFVPKLAALNETLYQ